MDVHHIIIITNNTLSLPNCRCPIFLGRFNYTHTLLREKNIKFKINYSNNEGGRFRDLRPPPPTAESNQVSRAAAAPVPTLLEELVEEILLRLPPAEPDSLVRAALVPPHVRSRLPPPIP